MRSATSSKYYYAHNHLYSPVAVMDFSAGTVLEWYDYDAYGATHIMDASYTARTASAVGNPYSFTGRELDTLDGGNLKAMHYRHRSYDPFVGRFGQHDPHRQVGMNLYDYVTGDPISYRDPYGTDRLRECLGYFCMVGPIDSWVASRCAEKAFSISGAYSRDPGTQNALRHCFYSACLYRSLTDDDAEQTLLIHEAANVRNVGTCDSNIDLWNNEMGRKIAEGTGQDIGYECIRALLNGDLTSNLTQARKRGLCEKKNCDSNPDTSGSKDSSKSESEDSDSYQIFNYRNAKSK